MADQQVAGTPDTLRRATVAREAIRAPGGGARRDATIAAAYLLAWIAAWFASGDYWYLPAGLRFAALWLTAPKRWPGFALLEVGAALLLGPAALGQLSWLQAALGCLVPWLGCALVVALLRPRGVYAAPESPGRMGATLGAMLVAAAVSAMLQGGLASAVGGPVAAPPGLAHGLGLLVRDYIGMLTLAPLVFQFFRHGAQGPHRRLLFDLAWMFAPLLALFVLLLQWRTPASLYAVILALVPMMLMAFRHGWRGSAWAFAATAVVLSLVRLRIEFELPPGVLQLFLAIVGSVALLLGSAIGSLRRVNVALIERNRLDQETNVRLAAQAEALRDLSRRLVRARDDEQRRLAHELHDELGQTVAALGTRLSLALRKADDPELAASLNAQRELVQRIQVSIREVLQGLRPAVLDRFGLEAALREGPIQRMLSDAGIEYDLRVSGPIERVGADTGSAVYRICQESATNCLRHAQARSFRLQVDVAPAWGGDLEVHLRIEDDGRGFDAREVEAGSLGGGLRGIRDRVMALAGEHRCESGAGGTRHVVWFVDRSPRADGALRSS